MKFAISASHFSLSNKFPLLLHYQMLTQLPDLNIKFTLIFVPPVKQAMSCSILMLLQVSGTST